MTWTLSFTSQGKDQIGDLFAVWNAGMPDECRFQKSVNLGDENSVSDFIAEAEKCRTHHDTDPDVITPILEALAVRMNS